MCFPSPLGCFRWFPQPFVDSEMANGSCVLCYFIKLNRKPETSGEVLLLSFSMGSKLWAAAWGCAGDAWGLPVRLVELSGLGSEAHARAVEAFQGPESQGRRDLDLSFEPRYIFFFDTTAWPMPNHGPEGFVRDVSLLFQEDFESGKVANGTLLVRLDEVTQAFFRRKPRLSAQYSALELDMLHWLKDELNYEERPMEHVNGSLAWLDSQYDAISNLETYDRYIASAKYLLGPRRRFANLTLLRRGHGLCMDMEAGHEGPSFVCFTHEAVNSSEECFMQAMTCDSWVYTCLEHPEAKVRDSRPARMGLGMVNDVEDCWPSCHPDVPQHVWQEMEEGLLFNARCANHQCRIGCCCNNVDLLEEEHAAEAANAVLISLLALMLMGLCCFNSRRLLRQNMPEQVIELTTLRPREPSSPRV